MSKKAEEPEEKINARKAKIESMTKIKSLKKKLKLPDAVRAALCGPLL